MKFLLDCVPCCRTATDPPLSPSSPSTSSPKSDETRSLVGGDGVRVRRRGKRTVGGGEWRPSLLAISEEGIEGMTTTTTATERKRVVVGTERKRCGFAAGTWYRGCRGGDRLGNEPIPMVIPAFAPTPFMF